MRKLCHFHCLGILTLEGHFRRFEILDGKVRLGKASQFLGEIVICSAILFVDVQEIVLFTCGLAVFLREIVNVIVFRQESLFLIFVSKVKANDVGGIDSHPQWNVLELLADKND